MAEAEEKVLKFIWKIENYSYCWNKMNEFLQSPIFQLIIFEGSSWCLKLYPRGVSSNIKDVSVYLERSEFCDGPFEITVDFEIALLRPDGTAEYVKENKNQCFRIGHTFGFDNLAVREEILETKKAILLPDDILTVQCRLFPKEAQLKSDTEIIAKSHIELQRSVFLMKLSANSPNAHFSPDNLAMRLVNLNPTLEIARMKVGILDTNDSVSWVLLDKQTDNFDTVDFGMIAEDKLRKQKSLYFPNNEFTIHWEVTFSFGVQHSQIEIVSCDNAFSYVTSSRKVSPEIDIIPKNLSCSYADSDSSFISDFQNLYQEGTLFDCTIKVENECIPAHKVVLGARSPVFKAMLTSNMKESIKNVVDISDLDVKTVRRMLRYMYTDTTGDLDFESSRKLYFAADKYAIMKLKLICSGVLERNLSVSTVGEVLSLANLHGDDYLKNLTLEFISSHETEVICSMEWKAFMTEEAYLAAETMRYILIKKAENSRGKT